MKQRVFAICGIRIPAHGAKIGKCQRRMSLAVEPELLEAISNASAVICMKPSQYAMRLLREAAEREGLFENQGKSGLRRQTA